MEQQSDASVSISVSLSLSSLNQLKKKVESFESKQYSGFFRKVLLDLAQKYDT